VLRRTDRVLRRIDARASDRSFGDFLLAHRGLPAADRRAARSLVEGFYAADAERISARSLAPAPGESPSDTIARVGRPLGGYGALAGWLARELGGAVRLGAPVTAVTWRRGHVELRLATTAGAQSPVVARAAILALPLGVLQAPADAPGALRFDPQPRGLRRALGGLVAGDALRVVLELRELPWESGGPLRDAADAFAGASFLRVPGSPFPTWWTPHPLRAPLLVAWAGGPAAHALAACSPEERADLAVRTLAQALHVARWRLAARLVGAWSHDWRADPFTRGAYSYVGVGGAGASGRLARPVERTLFLAGEATDEEHMGTVEGALRSGRRAARQVEAALRAG
jgi:monoamine oxidase